MDFLKNTLLVGIGGFIGSVGRYYISKLNLTISFFSIPVGTFIVNIFGSLIIGFIVGISEKSNLISGNIRLFLMVGICGGFTTFSSFTNENFTLLKNGQYLIAILYIFLSLLFGIFAVYTGYALTKYL